MEVTPAMHPTANIKVVGIGGGGGNAINRMVKARLAGVDFISINTDAQALHYNEAASKIHIGKETTRGLGAGGNPDVGQKAVEENIEVSSWCRHGLFDHWTRWWDWFLCYL
jgi:cell division protein FtsZ